VGMYRSEVGDVWRNVMLITVTTVQGKGKVKFPPFCAMKEYRGRVAESGFGPTVKIFFGPSSNGGPIDFQLVSLERLICTIGPGNLYRFTPCCRHCIEGVQV